MLARLGPLGLGMGTGAAVLALRCRCALVMLTFPLVARALGVVHLFAFCRTPNLVEQLCLGLRRRRLVFAGHFSLRDRHCGLISRGFNLAPLAPEAERLQDRGELLAGPAHNLHHIVPYPLTAVPRSTHP